MSRFLQWHYAGWLQLSKCRTHLELDFFSSLFVSCHDSLLGYFEDLMRNLWPNGFFFFHSSRRFQIEPVLIDEIGIALGSGPDGYRATFRSIEAYGVSNLTLTNIRWAAAISEWPRKSKKKQPKNTGNNIWFRLDDAGKYRTRNRFTNANCKWLHFGSSHLWFRCTSKVIWVMNASQYIFAHFPDQT